MKIENVTEEKLGENLLLIESEDSQAVEDRASYLTEMGWRESSRIFDAGRVRAMLEKVAA